MSRISTVYKVVHKSALDRLYSGFMVDYTPLMSKHSLHLEYKPSKYTHPAIGRIFAFDSLYHARLWQYIARYPVQIWEATALDSKASEFSYFTSSPKFVAYIADAFWSQDWDSVRRIMNSLTAFDEYTDVPSGTIICRALRLDKQVA